MLESNKIIAMKQSKQIKSKQTKLSLLKVRPLSSITNREYSYNPSKTIKQKVSNKYSFQKLRQQMANRKNQKYKQIILESTTMDLYNLAAQNNKDKIHYKFIQDSINNIQSSKRQQLKSRNASKTNINLFRTQKLPLSRQIVNAYSKSRIFAETQNLQLTFKCEIKKLDHSKSYCIQNYQNLGQGQNYIDMKRMSTANLTLKNKHDNIFRRSRNNINKRKISVNDKFGIVPWESQTGIENQFEF